MPICEDAVTFQCKLCQFTYLELLSAVFRGRKMNSNLEAAIQEAMSELDRQMAEQSAVRSSSSISERSQKSHDGKKRK